MKTLLTIILPLTIFLARCSYTTNTNSPASVSNDTLIIPSKIKMVADSEPGERMIISGTIYLPGGKTPAKNAILSVWHTDSKGFYIAGGGEQGRNIPVFMEE